MAAKMDTEIFFRVVFFHIVPHITLYQAYILETSSSLVIKITLQCVFVLILPYFNVIDYYLLLTAVVAMYFV